MTNERGTALLEVIVVGFAVILMVLPVISTVAKLTEATTTVHAAARDGAVWVARHGGEPPVVDGIVVSIVESGNEVEVVAAKEVTLIGVAGATVVRTVRSRVTVPISEYRSTR
jgi:hypothetical protein